MNKITALTTILLLSNLIGNAQSNYYVQNENKFFGGLVAGANFSQIDGDNYKGFDKVGLNLGAVVYTFINNEVAASMEILYTERGSYGKDVTDLGIKGVSVSNYRINLTYAEVPVMLHYFFKSKTHIGAGASFARLVTSKESGTTVPDQKFDQSLYPFKKYAVDLILDGNIRIWKGLYVNPRFQYSIIKVRADSEVPQYFGREQHSRIFSLRFCYLFGLK